MYLHPSLEKDTTFITDLSLCQVRLHENAEFPWLVLIPQRDDVIELIDLVEEDRLQLMKEISIVSQIMKELFNPDKLNVANLGNIVPQLHIHVIARYQNDKAWPNPVWNSGFFKEYSLDEKSNLVMKIRDKVSPP